MECLLASNWRKRESLWGVASCDLTRLGFSVLTFQHGVFQLWPSCMEVSLWTEERSIKPVMLQTSILRKPPTSLSSFSFLVDSSFAYSHSIDKKGNVSSHCRSGYIASWGNLLKTCTLINNQSSSTIDVFPSERNSRLHGSSKSPAIRYWTRSVP